MGGSCWRKLFLTVIFVNFCIDQGASIYFSQSQVTISRTFIPESRFLYVVKALKTTYEDGQIKYSISKPKPKNIRGKSKSNGGKATKCLDLIIDEDRGNISVSFLQRNKEIDHNALFQDGEIVLCEYKIFATLVKSNQGNGSRNDYDNVELNFTLNLNSPLSILAKDDDDACRRVSKEELCFGGASFLNLQIMENSKESPVAYIGRPLPGMCGTLKLSYNVSVSEGVLFTSMRPAAFDLSPSNFLVAKSNLDREAREIYNLTVTCIVESTEDSNKIELIQIGGNLTLLDENDNMLLVGEEGLSDVTLFVSFSDHDSKLRPGDRLYPTDHSDLLAEDKDTKAVNNFEIYPVNDTKGLLDFDFVIYETKKGESRSSYCILKIILTEHIEGVAPWDGDYCVRVTVNDSTMIPSKRHESLKYTICLIWGRKNITSTQPTGQPPKDELLDRLSHTITEATIPRTAQKYAPILYPYPDLLEDVSEIFPYLQFTLTHILVSYDENLDNNSNVEGYAMMSESEDTNVFEVTPKMAIIYLVRPEFIRNSSYKSFRLQLYCQSNLIPSFTTNITITLEGASPSKNESMCDDELCALHADSKSCELSCGYGSPGRCLWKHETGFNKSLVKDDSTNKSLSSPRYPTCSPRLDTCPDKKCDELEETYPHLCPQDCATSLRGFGKLVKHSNGKSYGVNGEFCKGVLTCHDSVTCSCAPLPYPITESSASHENRPSNGKNLAFSTTGKSNILQLDANCGPRCLVIYFALTLGAIGFIIVSVYIWKARVESKRKSRSLNQTVIMTADGIEMPFGNDNTGQGTLFSDGDYPGRGMNHVMLMSEDQFTQSQVLQVVDSKWEIPREDLLLEHILGEGQFGRVLKGRLQGRAVGHIAVAVKMLKVETAEGSKSVWQEFMAEFSLLKQVEHPNVIKLLGACTTTGGPPYLVMEYAEYGALRSFLRKCRRIETINASNGALHWDAPDLSQPSNPHPSDLDYIVTPREVLGFSWQIAKGMAYLSDMKMVHRDLAARNILLTKLKVCKISDFGMTRDIYVDDAYQKKSKDRVPVKWLAPECLADELYTTKSDVWAFGVLLWELTTLGASPYPGVQSEQLYVLLNAGYRMPQPQNCSNDLYTIMRRCWAYQPALRPSFHQIVLDLSKMLEAGIEYIQLEFPSQSNPGYNYFLQDEGNGRDVVDHNPVIDSPMTDIRPMSRRKLSMENLRLIDHEISTEDEFLRKRNGNSLIITSGLPLSTTPHTYINEPKTCEQDCSSKTKPVISSSGYESPIRSATSVDV